MYNKLEEVLSKIEFDYKINGDKDRKFYKANDINMADDESIAFYIGEDINVLKNSNAVIIVTNLDENIDGKTIITTKYPRQLFIKICNLSFSKSRYVSEHAIISTVVKIGNNVHIKPCAVIGYDGFSFDRNYRNYEMKEETPIKFPHFGGVIIEDDVDIGSNTCIDRGVFGDTIIRKGAKIDNLVHIAHNCDIGERVVIPAGVTLGGGVKIGNDSWIGVGAVILNKVNIGKNAFISAGSFVTRDVKDGQHVTGYFAIDHSKFIEYIKKR